MVVVSYIKKHKKLFLCSLILLIFVFGVVIGAKLNGLGFRHTLVSRLIHNSFYKQYVLRKDFKKMVHTKTDFINCPKNYKAIAIFGQSNAANRIKRPNGLKSISDGKTFMYDWTTRHCYSYAEPLVGTDGAESGNIITATIENFRKDDKNTNLIIIAFAQSGSSVFSWAQGSQSIRLDEVLSRLKEDHINPNLFLWHQGESDAIEEIYLPEKVKAYGMEVGTKKQFYETALDTVVQKVHSSFPNALVGVALASVCQNDGSEAVREAQNAIKNKYSWIEISSDTDFFGKKFRSDGCHFNENGEKYIALDYLKLVLKS